ncbi:putative membrane protein [Pacificibacter maritimus]|uniref:Protoporphyrinogen IX oxidase n=1 Tax=Pacificibacter maritimus TaxID=762213 RepID=A0A3N4USP7_9RHOB|nr:protoporphyrinogen oxidase HemJ [Pacificibacter maritimus]RPE64720.1 putative membrane protein [Pacificibacter maritimus]
MSYLLLDLYPWTKSLHVISVIAWMAGIFYLPRLFVRHTENVTVGSETDLLFQDMEKKLLKLIMNPAAISTWIFGLLLVLTPGVIDWTDAWPWIKAFCVIAMTWFHHWCAVRRKDFVQGENSRSGKHYRLMNELPTVLMIVIVVMIIARPI